MSFNFESAEQRYAFLAEHVRYNKTTGVFTRKSTGKVLVPSKALSARKSRLNPFILLSFGGKPISFSLCKLAYFKVHKKMPDGCVRVKYCKEDDALAGVIKAKDIEVMPRQVAQSGAKLSKANVSGYTGVCWKRKEGKWLAQYQSGGKTHVVGFFDDVHEAGAAVKRYRAQLGLPSYHGEL